MFATFSGTQVMGKPTSLDAESRALGTALAKHENVDQARKAYLDRATALYGKDTADHALLDVTGIIAWHSLISKVVDVAGFDSVKVPTVIGKLGHLAVKARAMRVFLMTPLTWSQKLLLGDSVSNQNQD